ncbi:beta-ketoacyl-ACP reductase [soil metagenome]
MALKGKIALVTGGGSGIGRGIAQAFAADGAFVYIASRRGQMLDECVREITAAGGQARAVPTDLGRAEDVHILMREIKDGHGALDILVNAAGVMRVGLVADASEGDFDETFNSNVKSLWLTTKLAIPLMKGRAGANVIHISSIGAVRADTGLGLYEASKAAVNCLTKVMAKELAKDRIRVNAIAPGPTDTQFFSGSFLGDDVERKQSPESSDAVPFGRVGLPDEIARLAIYLASPESDLISGSITSIDGAVGY